MKPETERLEHLFTRVLDGEATPAERRLLDTLRARDPHVSAFFDDYAALDREVGAALRWAVHPVPRKILLRASWTRVGKGLAVAVAACLATLAWLRPAAPRATPVSTPPKQAASWFVPSAPQSDAVENVPAAYERPELRMRGTQRQWIVIPGREPGTFRIIQVDRVRTHVIGVHRDY